MAKQVSGQAKFQIPGGQATPAPPVGTSLGKYGINLGQFVQQFNDRTKEYNGTPIPVIVTVYGDRSFDFVTKSGKRKITKRKLYPGYIMVNMVINDATWFAVRETPGIGDFTGSAGKPTPMDPREVERILRRDVDEDEETQIKTSIPFNIGDHVRVKEGNFQNFEGDVDKIDEAHGLITVMINIFNRATPVEIQYWQIEKV